MEWTACPKLSILLFQSKPRSSLYVKVKKKQVKTPPKIVISISSQKLWQERKIQTRYKMTENRSLHAQRNKTSAEVIWKTKWKHPFWVGVVKIHIIVAKCLVPTTAGGFWLCRKVRRCWLQGQLLAAPWGCRGRFGLFDLAEDLKAKQRQERSVLSPHDEGRSLSSAVDHWASLNPPNQQEDNKQFPHIYRGASQFWHFHQWNYFNVFPVTPFPQESLSL